MRLRVLVLVLVFAVLSCGSQEHDRIIDDVVQLPEVSLVKKRIKTSSEGRAVMKLWIHAEPSENNKNLWWVKAGEDNGENMTTHLNVKLNETGTQIWFYEILSNSLIPMNEWRKSTHYPFK